MCLLFFPSASSFTESVENGVNNNKDNHDDGDDDDYFYTGLESWKKCFEM